MKTLIRDEGSDKQDEHSQLKKEASSSNGSESVAGGGGGGGSVAAAEATAGCDSDDEQPRSVLAVESDCEENETTVANFPSQLTVYDILSHVVSFLSITIRVKLK